MEYILETIKKYKKHIIVGVFLFIIIWIIGMLLETFFINWLPHKKFTINGISVGIGFIIALVSSFGLFIWFKNPDNDKNRSAGKMNNFNFNNTKLLTPHEQVGYVVRSQNIKNETNVSSIDKTHNLIIGATDSGKTSGLLIPSMLLNIYSDSKPSMIVTDPKSEIFNYLKSHLKKKNYNIQILNLTKKTSIYDITWNPLNKIWKEYKQNNELEDAIQLIESLTETILLKDSSDPNSHWNTNAVILVSAMIKAYLISPLADAKDFHLCKFASYLSSQSTLKTFTETFAPNNEELNGFLLDEGEKHSCISTARTSLKWFTTSLISKITSTNFIKLNNLRKQPSIIFIIFDYGNEVAKVLTSIFLNEIQSQLESLQNELNELKNEREVYYFLDEFGNLPKIAGFASYMSVARHYGIRFCVVLQSVSQLDKYRLNGEKETILDGFGLICYLYTNNQKSTSYFSEKFGTKIIESISKTQQPKGDFSRHMSDKEVPLYSVSDLMQLQKGEMVFMLSRSVAKKSKLVSHLEIK